MNATHRSPQEAREALLRYLRRPPEGPVGPEPPLRRTAKRLLPGPARPLARRLVTDALAPWERRKAGRLAGRSPLRLHLGSGRTPKAGWVNLDLAGAPVDLAWNLGRPLPFPDGTVDAVFHEHVLEHFTLERGLALTRECFRVLKPGGVLRAGVPDALAYARSYLAGGGVIEAVRPDRPTPLLAMQEAYYRHGHRTMYDAATLALLCLAAGFPTAEGRPFGESRLAPCPDSRHRRAETVYVEAVKQW